MAETYQGDVCKASHSFILDNFIRRFIQKPEKILNPYIQKGNTAIDLGCGPGFFTLCMAGMVGEKGKVIAVDLQDQMLEKVRRKSKKQGFEKRIYFHACSQDSLDIDPAVKADFILAFYMIHETPDQSAFLKQVKALLKDQGVFLVVEPLFHVSRKDFEITAQTARNAGFKILDRPGGKGGRSLLL